MLPPPAAKWPSPPFLAPGRLQGPDARRADGEDWPTLGLGPHDRERRRLGDGVFLRVHDVLLDILRPHGEEGTEAHMEGHEGLLDALGLEGGEYLLREMEAGRRGGGRARIGGIDGLIALGVIPLVPPS